MKTRRRPADGRGLPRATGVTMGRRRAFPGVNSHYAGRGCGLERRVRPCGRFRLSGSPACSSSAPPRLPAPPRPPCPAPRRLPPPPPPRRGRPPAAEADLFAMPRHRRGEPRRARDGAGGRPRGGRGDARRAARRASRASASCRPTAPRSPCSRASPRRRAPASMRAVGARLRRARRLLADPLFAPLAADPRSPRWRRRRPARGRPPPVAALVAGGIALVGGANTAWNPATERLEPRFAFPPTPDGRRAAARPPRSPPATSCASTRGAAAPPATTAISTTTATAAIPALDPAAHPQVDRGPLCRRRPRRRRRLRPQRQPALRPGRPSAIPRPR